METNASYKIIVQFDSRLSGIVLTQRLQLCFDQGAAGEFALANSDGLEKKVVFVRDALEDAVLVATRTTSVVGWRSAAAQQLADELAELCDGDLQPVLDALREGRFELEDTDVLEEAVVSQLPGQIVVAADPCFIVRNEVLTDQSEVFNVFFVSPEGNVTEIYPAMDEQDAADVCARLNAALATGRGNEK